MSETTRRDFLRASLAAGAGLIATGCTIVVSGYGIVEVDFVADNPGVTLFHCPRTLHTDYGFMRLFRYA